MPQLSLTDFVDIALRAGTPKLTKVREIKNRPRYEPSTDFWRALRLRIIEAHEQGHGPGHLSKSMVALTDRKKKTAYPPLVEAYKKWWGRKEYEWFKPPTEMWTSGPVSVSVNPEIGLRVDERETVIKLYFKADKLTKNRLDVILYLMQETLGAEAPGATMGVMDVRHSKLFVPTIPIPDLGAMLRGEAAFIASVWESIE